MIICHLREKSTPSIILCPYPTPGDHDFNKLGQLVA